VVRDRLAYWYFRQLMPAPREVAATLLVNDAPNGAFEIEERWDRDAVKPYFQEPYGALYRLRGMIGADPFAYAGPDAATYVPAPWDPVGSHPTDDHLEIPRALALLANDPGNLDQGMNVDAVLNYFASNALLANTDGFTGDLEIDDFYEYFDPASGQLFILPWDPDNTFGSINDPPDRDIFQNYGKSVLTRLIRDSADMRARFFAKLEEWMSRIPLDAIDHEIDAVYEQVRPSVAADTLKQYPTEHFDWSLGYVKDFIAARYASVQAQLAAYRNGSPPPPSGEAPSGATP
jgi:spore coat protein CotH